MKDFWKGVGKAVIEAGDIVRLSTTHGLILSFGDIYRVYVEWDKDDAIADFLALVNKERA